MVCRLWDHLCYTPELLGNLEVHVGGNIAYWGEEDKSSAGSRVEQFFDWLAGSGGGRQRRPMPATHVQRLEVKPWGTPSSHASTSADSASGHQTH